MDDDDVSFDADTNTTSLSLDDGEGRYYRAVATYDADGEDDSEVRDSREPMERVVSDPIQVADIRDDDSSAPTPRPVITGSPDPGGTLSVDAGSATVKVQWQMRENAATVGTYDWVNIPNGAGDLRLSQEHAGKTVRAVVSYQSRDPNNPGSTVVVVAEEPVGDDLDGDGTTTLQDGSTRDRAILIAGTSSNVPPVKVADYEFDVSVSGTGHGFFRSSNISPAGHNTTIEQTVPLSSLFQDPDTPGFLISYSAAALVDQSGDTLANVGSAGGSTYVYEQAGGVLIFESKGGKLTYLTDQYQGHDGAGNADNTDSVDNDGKGNWITLQVRADDTPGPDGLTTGGNTGGSADVMLRINVAPTNIHFLQDAERDGADVDRIDANNEPVAQINFVTAYGVRSLHQIMITENDFEGAAEYMGPGDPDQAPLAILDVQDENWSGSAAIPGHKFGTHKITVTGDERFVISKTGGDDPRRDQDSDGSTWELHAVKGATFDYETDDADGNPRNGIQIVLTFSATDGGGLSTPTPNAPSVLYDFGASSALLANPASAPGFQNRLHLPIQLVVTIVNADQEDESDPPRRRDEDTPGLKDDESNDPDDTKDDDGDSSGDHDDDTDGGAPPPPGMSLGGLIKDFIDNMDQGEADLLGDYLLTIDDGLDIA